MDECCCYDHAGAEVLGRKEALVDEFAFDGSPSCPDGEDGAEEGSDQDDEDGGDADANVAVVVVATVTMARRAGEWNDDGGIFASRSSNGDLSRNMLHNVANLVHLAGMEAVISGRLF